MGRWLRDETAGQRAGMQRHATDPAQHTEENQPPIYNGHRPASTGGHLPHIRSTRPARGPQRPGRIASGQRPVRQRRPWPAEHRVQQAALKRAALKRVEGQRGLVGTSRVLTTGTFWIGNCFTKLDCEPTMAAADSRIQGRPHDDRTRSHADRHDSHQLQR